MYELRLEFDKALEMYAGQEKLCNSWSYLSEDCLQAQGNILLLKGDWQGAFNYYSKQQNKYYRIGSFKDLGLQNVLSHQAMVKALTGDNKGAKEIYEEIGKVGSKSTQNKNLEDLSNFKSLLSAFEEQEEEYTASGMKSRLIISLINQGLIYYYAAKQRKYGFEVLKKAEDLSQSIPQCQVLYKQLIGWRIAVKTFFWKR